MLFNNLPLFDAIIDDIEEGIQCISCVSDPATQIDWLAFAKSINYKFSEDRHIVTGVLMLANTPIYRVSPMGFEYYIQFKPETIKQMMRKMLNDGTFNNVDFQHSENMLEGFEMQELFYNDGKVIEGFENIPEGSAFITYKVTNDDAWNKIKAGEWKGFSLSGIFEQIPSKFEKNNNDIKMNLKEIKNQIKQLLLQMGSVNVTDVEGVERVLEYEGDELAKGAEVYVSGEDAEPMLAPDGVYKTADGMEVEVKDGMVADIREAVAEEVVEEVVEEVKEEMEEETPEEKGEEPVMQPEEKEDEAVQGLRKEMNEAYAKIDELAARVEALEGMLKKVEDMSAAKPAEIAVEDMKTNELKGAARYAQYLRK